MEWQELWKSELVEIWLEVCEVVLRERARVMGLLRQDVWA